MRRRTVNQKKRQAFGTPGYPFCFVLFFFDWVKQVIWLLLLEWSLGVDRDNEDKHWRFVNKFMVDYHWKCKYLYCKLQCVPINIVHGEITHYLKSRNSKDKFYSILKPMVLFIIGEKFKKIHWCKYRDNIDFIRLYHFPPAQLESCS